MNDASDAKEHAQSRSSRRPVRQFTEVRLTPTSVKKFYSLVVRLEMEIHTAAHNVAFGVSVEHERGVAVIRKIMPAEGLVGEIEI
jgi:hypothetical protein